MATQAMPNADNRPSEDVVVRKSVRASNPPKYLAVMFSRRNDMSRTYNAYISYNLRYSGVHTLRDNSAFVKGALYRIWCGLNRLGDSGVKVV